MMRYPCDLHLWRRDDVWPAAIVAGDAQYTPSCRKLQSPIDAGSLGEIGYADGNLLSLAIGNSQAAALRWRLLPAPRRGELVRRIGLAVRAHKQELAALITVEAGKISAEAEGEVQEWIDLCDYAVGLSRQLHGLSIVSERPGHRMMEQWLPLGPIGVITAFNFPLAVWAWNAMLALVCGDSVLWKPSEKTPLCALAAARLVGKVIADFGDDAPAGLCNLVLGDGDVGRRLAIAPQLPLLSATGSVAMGRAVAQSVAARLGRSLLELGGNNALIVSASANLELAVRAIVFSAVGTCGQRCTSLRRLIIHRSLLPSLAQQLQDVYRQLNIGDPRLPATLVGPLIDARADAAMQNALATALTEGGELLYGGKQLTGSVPTGGCYVQPALLLMPQQTAIVRQETFAPLLYLLAYDELDEAIALNNAVPQGLSSAIFTNSLQEAEHFVSASGSDCGIANVNIGTSGAEIGGAFGGEKDTGGGREAGSDAWKNYMRRSTNTINYGKDLPLAQGIRFET